MGNIQIIHQKKERRKQADGEFLQTVSIGGIQRYAGWRKKKHRLCRDRNKQLTTKR